MIYHWRMLEIAESARMTVLSGTRAAARRSAGSGYPGFRCTTAARALAWC